MCPSTSRKTYIRNPSLFFISFSPSHLEGNNDGYHDPRAHICAWGGEFCQVSIFTKLVETNFSCFAKIIWMPSWFAKLLELLILSSEQHSFPQAHLNVIKPDATRFGRHLQCLDSQSLTSGENVA
jgi:hypothetical protein